MRRLFTVLIWIVLKLDAADRLPAVKAKRVQPTPAAIEAPAVEKKPDSVIEYVAPKLPELDPNTKEVVKLSEAWRNQTSTVSGGPGGTIRFAFGEGLPVLVCAPLRVCDIELQAGEKLSGEPALGDTVRWKMIPSLYGDDAPILIFKPSESGLDSNVVIPTDRRVYKVRLLSRPTEWVTGIAFRYPEEDARKWEMLQAKKEDEKRVQLRNAVVSAEALNFGYTIKGEKKLSYYPLRIFDDGSKTYIQMKPELASREAPALSVIGEDGKGIMTNYRVKDGTYIVDRMFDEAVLKLGVKKSKPVRIIRDGKAS